MFKDEFMNYWTASHCTVPPTDKSEWEAWAREASDGIFANIYRQYISEERDNPVLRLSGLGKYHIVELLAKKFGLIEQGGDFTVDEQCRSRFLTGDIFEHTFMFMIKRWGFKVEATQTDVNFHGVSGHTDAVVTTPEGERCLLEFKTSNNYYFTQVKKWIGDERGYLTQLVTYSHCLDLPAYWVFVNKDTSDIFIKPLTDVPQEIRDNKLKRANHLVKAFNECPSYEEFPLYCRVPPPKIEKTKAGDYKYWEDGSLRLYVGDFDFKKPELFYVVDRKPNDYKKMRNYVVDFRYPDKYAHLKPNIEETALHFDATGG